MKIFNKEELEDYADYVCKLRHCDDLDMNCGLTFKELEAYKKACFVVGVNHAESKIEDLCIEFAEYYYDNCDENGNYEFQFNQFLKGRNNEKR